MLIEHLFVPPEVDEEEQLAIAILQGALGEEHANNNTNNTNDNSTVIEESQVEKGQIRRRKSFSDGLCDKTLKSRFAELDDLIMQGIIFLPFVLLTF